MKKLCVLLALAFVAGCTPSSKEGKTSFALESVSLTHSAESGYVINIEVDHTGAVSGGLADSTPGTIPTPYSASLSPARKEALFDAARKVLAVDPGVDPTIRRKALVYILIKTKEGVHCYKRDVDASYPTKELRILESMLQDIGGWPPSHKPSS